MPRISVVVLCYKAGEAVPAFVERVKGAVSRLTGDFQIVLVGNHNPGDTADVTPAVVARLAAADPRITAVVREKEGMMGWDARTGLDAATGDIIVLIDGDNQMPPEDIEAVVQKLTDESLDLAMTYRADRRDGLVRRLNSRLYNLVFSTLFPGYPVHDVNAKPKAFTRAFFDKLALTNDGWCLDAEIMIQARRRHARLGQIPTVFFRSEDRKSFVRPGAVWEFVKFLLVSRLREFCVRP